MEKKTNAYLTASLGIMILGSLGLFFFSREDTQSAIDRGYFKIAETEKIDRVTLQSPQGSIELKFENNRWKVNGRWDADLQMIKVLLATMKQVEPRRPVANAMKDSVLQLLEKTGIHVTLFEGEKTGFDFMAGGNSSKTETWFLRNGDGQPYVMMIPGYRVYVAGILELDESGWRNKRIFDFNWRNFKSLKATYPGDPKQSFEIELQGRYFGIKDMAAVDTTRLNDYLDAISLLFASRFVSPGSERGDSLKATSPAVTIEIGDIAGKVYNLQLFKPTKTDGEIYGRLADGQLVALDRNKTGEIVRRREYFMTRRGR